MPFSIPTIQKFFREEFKGDNPIQVDPSELDEWEEKIKTHLQDVQNVFIYNTRYRSSFRAYTQERKICQLVIRQHYEDDKFDLVCNADNQLQIETRKGQLTALVSDLDELLQFITVCQERFDRRRTQYLKTSKRRELSEQGFGAQLVKAAKEDDFRYTVSYEYQGIFLKVYLSDKRLLKFKLSRQRLLESLPSIRAAIQAAKTVEAQGLSYNIVDR
ncbi:MAG: hypothetical protein AAF639_02840 [Chloroflexota bacterium]